MHFTAQNTIQNTTTFIICVNYSVYCKPEDTYVINIHNLLFLH